MSASSTAPLTLVPNNTIRSLIEANRFRQSASGAPLRAPAMGVLSLWAGETLQTLQLVAGEAVQLVPRQFVLARLWEQAIREREGQNWSAGDVAATAREALEADRLLLQWVEGARPASGSAEADKDGPWLRAEFHGWRQSVLAVMAARGWTDASRQMESLCERLERAPVPAGSLPGAIELRGFLELTPLETRLLEALARQGVLIGDDRPDDVESARSAIPVCSVFRSLDDELRDAADWAFEHIGNGSGRIAVAVNGLNGVREKVLYHFMQRFEPQAALAMERAPTAAFHVVGGLPLATHPLVTALFDLLELSRQGIKRPIGFGLISRWLLSSAWAGAVEEAAGRAQLELRLRRRGKVEFKLVEAALAAEGLESEILRERVSRLPGVTTGGAPVQQLLAWLEHWGWPGRGLETPSSRPVLDAVLSAFETLERADVNDLEAAIAGLRALLQEKSHQPAGGVLSPVQVLDVSDLVVEGFERVRLVNVHADNWPEPPRLNRLLPYRVARQLPGGDSSSQMRRTRARHDALLRRYPGIEMSRAAYVDGVPTAISPLLVPLGAPADPVQAEHGTGVQDESVAVATPAESRDAGRLARAAFPGVATDASRSRDRLTAIERRNAPPVVPGEERLRGVVGLLNTQSASPWAAFLRYRLGAEFPDWPSAFPDLAYTGSLVHHALDALYRGHRGRGTLPSATEVPGAVALALRECFADQVLSPAVMAVEQRRITALLTEWLAFEATQSWPAPQAVEEELEAELGGFRLQLRIDRTDSAPDGLLILDYKTGFPQSPDWSSTRLTDIQLPLYAVLLSDQDRATRGIGLLTVRANGMAQTLWTGDAALAGKGVAVMGQGRAPFADWAAALGHWRSALSGLLEEYRLGDATQVVHHEGPLRYLGLELLMRAEDERISEGFGHAE